MLIFYQQDSKEKNYKCFGGKLMQKHEEETLKKKLKIGIACLAHKIGPTSLLS